MIGLLVYQNHLVGPVEPLPERARDHDAADSASDYDGTFTHMHIQTNMIGIGNPFFAPHARSVDCARLGFHSTQLRVFGGSGLVDGLFALKSATIALLVYHAVLLLTMRRTPLGWCGGAFALCIACYLVCGITHGRPELRVLHLTVLLGCVSGPFFLWLFARALFDDGFRPGIPHAVVFVVVEGLTILRHERLPEAVFSFLGAYEAAGALMRLFPQVFSIAFVALGVWAALADRANDLVEGRRRLRHLFVFGVSAYAAMVLFVEIVLRTQPPPLLEWLHISALLAFNMAFGLWSLRIADSALPATARAATASGSGPVVDPGLSERLTALMDDEQLFRQERLILRDLARRLGVPEYRLRRFINGSLGFRNFNDFVNQHRVRAACATLSDAKDRGVPIIRIAMDLGFGSLAPFNRAFRANTGMTPTQYRERALGGSDAPRDSDPARKS